MKHLLYTTSLAALIGFLFPHNIVGNWVSNGQNNSKVLLAFKENGDFKVTVDGATENEGTYRFYRDTFVMYDNNCGMLVPGKYKITFFTPDSAAFSVISDSCKDRSGEINGGVIKRVK
jgi:hypothetical protein